MYSSFLIMVFRRNGLIAYLCFMKRICISISVLFLSALVILGSGKYAIGKMICIGNGHATYSLGNAKDCCEKNGTQRETIKKSCCELINVAYSLDDFSPSSKITSSPEQLVFTTPAFSLLPPISNIQYPIFYSDLPLPDIKDLLYSFRSLLL